MARPVTDDSRLADGAGRAARLARDSTTWNERSVGATGRTTTLSAGADRGTAADAAGVHTTYARRHEDRPVLDAGTVTDDEPLAHAQDSKQRRAAFAESFGTSDKATARLAAANGHNASRLSTDPGTTTLGTRLKGYATESGKASLKAKAKRSLYESFHATSNGAEEAESIDATDAALGARRTYLRGRAAKRGTELVAGEVKAARRAAARSQSSRAAAQAKKGMSRRVSERLARQREEASVIYGHGAGEWVRSVARAAATSVRGTIASVGSMLAGASAPLLLPAILVVILVVILGAVTGEEEKKTIDGLPSWVSYEMVLACLEARDEYGIPASANLGQLVVENGSGSGSSLGREYHNYGGVKYYGLDANGYITGPVDLETSEMDSSGNYYTTTASFAVFADDEAFMKYRVSESLLRSSRYTSLATYQQACSENNSELFLRALGEGGYYTADPDSYVATYEAYCAQFPLIAELDSMTTSEFASRYSGVAGTGEEYSASSGAARAIADAAMTAAPTASGRCAAWVSRVYADAGYDVVSGNACDHWANYCHSNDRSELKVGMIVAVDSVLGGTAASIQYGHTGIYVGDGLVMHSTGGTVHTDTLDSWIATFGGNGRTRWGYPPGLD